MKRIDHAAAAQRLLDAGTTQGILPNHVAAAQAHATLALVEQQRLANLLTVMRMESGPDEIHKFGKGIQQAVDRLWPTASEWGDE